MTEGRDFSRQSFLGSDAEETLANVRVAIVGLGGGGSHIAQQLAHLGVGHFRFIDPDRIEASNLNRLVGATQADVDEARYKVDIAERSIKAIRPWATVKTAKQTWQHADVMLKDVHVIFGCVDGYQQRDFLESAARRFCVPYIDIGMDIARLAEHHFAIAGQMILSLPGGPCMRCLGFLTPERLAKEENRYGDAGINPQVIWTNGTLASLAVGTFVRLVAPWWSSDETFNWLELDGNRQTVAPSQIPDYTPRQPTCPHHGGTGDPFFDLRKVIL